MKHFEIPFRAMHAQIETMHWFALTENNAATETVVRAPLGRRQARDLLLPRLLSGQVNLKEN
jgi:hypothetical protein